MPGAGVEPARPEVDHRVFGDETEAAAEAQRLETDPLRDACGVDSTSNVVLAARVITLGEYEAKMGKERLHRFLTAYRACLSEVIGEPGSSQLASDRARFLGDRTPRRRASWLRAKRQRAA